MRNNFQLDFMIYRGSLMAFTKVDVGHIPSGIKLMADVVRPLIARGEGVLIYTEYEDTYNYLADYLNSMKKDIGFDNLYKITG